MKSISRREFVSTAALAAAAIMTPCGTSAAEARRRKMTIDLVCGSIGVSANQREAVDLAARHGFESVGADGGFLASQSDGQLAELKSAMNAKGLVFGAAGLPVEFRQDDSKFEESLKGLPGIARGLKRAGVRRVSTWLTPCSRQLTYLENFRTHAKRLREVAKVLKDSELRLGLEYVGPKMSWTSQKYPFIHTMTEMKELIGEIGTGNVGFLLDSWHWWHAGESATEILSLKAEDVVAVDLNDAPAGGTKEQLPDSRRELPCATGVIPVETFLKSLDQIGYDGPVRVEPFNQKLNSLGNDEACAEAAASLKKAFALITS
jgi:sugar phosphate isomerase/epimerase